MDQVKVKAAGNSFKDKHVHITTWVPIEDFEILRKAAEKNKVTFAAYIRAILVDVVHEESCIEQVKV